MYNYGNYYYHTQLAAANIIYMIFSFGISVLSIVAMWKLFTKAGRPGWHSIIPFLNVYDLVCISWTKKKAKTTIILSIIGIAALIIGSIALTLGAGVLLAGSLGSYSNAGAGLAGAGGMGAIIGFIIFLAGLVVTIIAAIYEIIAVVKLGVAFGKDSAFGVGLFFLTPIFMMILAFGNARHLGNDEERAANQSQMAGGMGGFCQSCGKPYEFGTKFCQGCGRPLT